MSIQAFVIMLSIASLNVQKNRSVEKILSSKGTPEIHNIVPVIFYSMKLETGDVVSGLNLGAKFNSYFC